jgi:hypothetical protein
MGTGFKDITIGAAQSSAFGTIETAELTPVVQADWTLGILTRVGTATASGTGAVADSNAGRLRLQSGTASGGYAHWISELPIQYREGQGVTTRFTVAFGTAIANNIQFAGVGTLVSNAPYDGYGFMANGSSYGIGYYRAGVLSHVAQASWSVNPNPFTLTSTNLQVCQIKYPFLGAGDITFWLQNPTTAAWNLVHVIEYAGSSTAIQITNPILNGLYITRNAAVVANTTMYGGSFSAFVSGAYSYATSPNWATDSNKSSITTETNLLSIRNATTVNGVTNRAVIRINSISFGSSAASGIANLRLKTGVTLGGSPAFTPISGSTADNGVTLTSAQSISSVDTAGTTVTGGTYIHGIAIDNPSNALIDLTPLNIILPPGRTLTFSGFSSATATQTVTVNITEDV